MLEIVWKKGYQTVVADPGLGPIYVWEGSGIRGVLC